MWVVPSEKGGSNTGGNYGQRNMSNLKGFETEADKNLAAGQTIKADVMNTNFIVQHKAAVT